MIETKYPPVVESQYQQLLKLVRLAEWLGMKVDESSLVKPELKNKPTFEQIQFAKADLYPKILAKYQELEMSKAVASEEAEMRFLRRTCAEQNFRFVRHEYQLSEFFGAAKVRMEYDLSLIPQGATHEPYKALNAYYER